jgi:hypothetical protein
MRNEIDRPSRPRHVRHEGRAALGVWPPAMVPTSRKALPSRWRPPALTGFDRLQLPDVIRTRVCRPPCIEEIESGIPAFNARARKLFRWWGFEQKTQRFWMTKMP